MDKKIISKICLILIISLVACQPSKSNLTMEINGVKYPEIFVKSGYYFDKASMSDALLSSMLEKVTIVDQPDNLGVVEFPDFKNIKLVNNTKEEVDDAQIEAELEKERDQEISYTPLKTKRAAKMGDKVVIDFKGFINGEELEGGASEDYELVLGSGQFIPGFEEAVSGHTAGRKFTFDIKFPDDYDPSLAGKDAKFEVTIKSIEEAVTPEINEEFVAKHTKVNSKTVDEYKEEIKKRLEDRNEMLNNQNLIYQLTDYLFENTKFIPTEEALAWQFSQIISQYNNQAKQNGTTFADMVAASGVSVKDAYDEIKSSVPQAVQYAMITEELIKKYPSKVSEDDVKKWFEKISSSFGYGNDVDFEEYKKYIGYDNLKKAVEQENALMAVIKECNVVDEGKVEK